MAAHDSYVATRLTMAVTSVHPRGRCGSSKASLPAHARAVEDRRLTPAQRTMRARAAAFALHARKDPRETAQAARRAFLTRFERDVDPDGVLPENERRQSGGGGEEGVLHGARAEILAGPAETPAALDPVARRQPAMCLPGPFVGGGRSIPLQHLPGSPAGEAHRSPSLLPCASQAWANVWPRLVRVDADAAEPGLHRTALEELGYTRVGKATFRPQPKPRLGRYRALRSGPEVAVQKPGPSSNRTEPTAVAGPCRRRGRRRSRSQGRRP